MRHVGSYLFNRDQHDEAGGQTAHGHDDRLACMIEEVDKLMEPLKFASDAERAIALAQ